MRWIESTLIVADATLVWFSALVLLALLAIAAQAWLIRRYRRWLSELGQSAAQLAKGDLSRPIRSTGPPPVAALAETLNHMAEQLADRLAEVVRQRNELGTILSSMDEGVVAVDSELRVISLNRSAATLLKLDPAQVIDRPIDKAISDPTLRTFFREPLETGKGMQGEVTLTRQIPLALPRSDRSSDRSDGGGSQESADGPTAIAQPTQAVKASHTPVANRTIEAQSAILRDAAGRRMGAVLVLHDVTQLRRLESIRQDFVANVSHEIRTPVSAIKAAAETLVDDLEYDPDQPPTRETMLSFLGIISRQSERLNAIVDDLLSLARIEQGKRDQTVELEAGPLSPVIAAAVETCQAKADAKQVSVRVTCETGLIVAVNRMMLEQALINLVDNAIKYSPEQTRVEVSASMPGSEVIISVKDEGRGIEPEHLPRLFERFYRTDKARSRQLGGTGLGLSIVKHIAEAHGGRVTVESRPGQGSTFTLSIQPGDRG
ncbi:MAG: ATP-binding protein [Planctomycetota bacterium]